MRQMRRSAVLAFSICAGAFAQVNIYTPSCLTTITADKTYDNTTCLNGAFQSGHNTVAVGPGIYTINGTLNMDTGQTLVGAGPTETILYFCNNNDVPNPNMPSSCSDLVAGIVIARPQTSNFNTFLGGGLGGLQHLTVYGPVTSSNPNDPIHQPIGVLLGDPNPNCGNSCNHGDGVRLEDVVIIGWVTGVEIGAYSWSDTFQHVRWNANIEQHLYAPMVPSSGEKIVVSDCQFVNGLLATTIGILDLNGTEWMIDHSTFDGIPGPAIVVANSVNPGGNHLNISHSHFEVDTLSNSGFITNQSSGTPTISIQDTTFLVNSSVSGAQAMINTSQQVSQVNIVGGWVDSAQAIYFVNTAQNVSILSVAGNAKHHITGLIANKPQGSMIVLGAGFK